MASESKSNLLNRGLSGNNMIGVVIGNANGGIGSSSSSSGGIVVVGNNGNGIMIGGNNGNGCNGGEGNNRKEKNGKEKGNKGIGIGIGIGGENDKKDKKDDIIKLFGVNLSYFPNYIQFIILLTVIMIGFLLIGFVEEGFKHTFPDFTFGWFMTAIELMLFTVLAAMERVLKETNPMTMSGGSIGNSSGSNGSSSNNNAMMGSSNGNNNNNNNSITIVTSSNTSNNMGGILTSTTTATTNPYHKMDDNCCSSRITIADNNNNNNKNNNNNMCDHEEINNLKKMNSMTKSGNEKTSLVELLLEKNNTFNQSYLLNKIMSRKVPLIYHIIVALAMTASRGLTNISLLLMNYPTQVIFKSMKLISVMIGSKLFLHKDYNIYEYLAAPLMVGAAIAFSLGDARESLNFNLWGIIVVLVSLIFDSIHANAQEYTLKLHRDTALELLLYSNFFSGIFAAMVGICAGELGPLFIFLASRSLMDILGWFTVRVLCLYIGVAALVVFTQRFGAVAAVTITTVRKILTVLLSYVLWPNTKSFGMPHGMGTLMFFGSLVLNGAGVHYKSN